MTFAPRFSPTATGWSWPVEGREQRHLHHGLHGRGGTQLTRDNSISTAPSFAPDGHSIAFESDRGGSQQIYVMNADGSNAHRISYRLGQIRQPVWSPRGDLIAFTKMQGGQFYIGVMHPDGKGEREIATAFHVEGRPGPNGRVLAYFKELPTGVRRTGRSAQVYTIDLTGFNEVKVPTPLDGSDPAWSPINPKRDRLLISLGRVYTKEDADRDRAEI